MITLDDTNPPKVFDICPVMDFKGWCDYKKEKKEFELKKSLGLIRDDSVFLKLAPWKYPDDDTDEETMKKFYEKGDLHYKGRC